MGPVDEAIAAGYSIVGVSTWFSYPVPPAGAGKIGGTRHLQIVYLQKGGDVRVLHQEVDNHGRVRWKEGDL